jgi:hypothetical protein
VVAYACRIAALEVYLPSGPSTEKGKEEEEEARLVRGLMKKIVSVEAVERVGCGLEFKLPSAVTELHTKLWDSLRLGDSSWLANRSSSSSSNNNNNQETLASTPQCQPCFGDNYYYAKDILKKLIPREVEGGQLEGMSREEKESLLHLTAEANLQLSLADSQLFLFRSWKSLLQILLQCPLPTTTTTITVTTKMSQMAAWEKRGLSQADYDQLIRSLMNSFSAHEGVFLPNTGEELSSLVLFLFGNRRCGASGGRVDGHFVNESLEQLTKVLASIFSFSSPLLTSSSSSETLINCLASLLVLLKSTPKNHTYQIPEPEMESGTSSGSSSSPLLILLPFVFKCLESGTTTTTTITTKSISTTLALSVMILDVIFALLESSSSSSSTSPSLHHSLLFPILKSNDVYPLLVSALTKAIAVVPMTSTFSSKPLEKQMSSALFSSQSYEYQSVDALLHLLLSLSHYPTCAEALISFKIMEVFCSSSSSGFGTVLQLQLQGVEMYSQQGERTPGHKLWCLTLKLVGSLLQTLRGSDQNFVNSCIHFSYLYQERFASVLGLPEQQQQYHPQQQQQQNQRQLSGRNPSLVFSVASLEEAEAITVFLYQMTHHIPEWRLGFVFLSFLPPLLFGSCSLLILFLNPTANSSAIEYFRTRLLVLCADYCFILMAPRQAGSPLRPISKEEKHTNNKALSSSSSLSIDNDSEFQHVTTSLMYSTMINSISFVREFVKLGRHYNVSTSGVSPPYTRTAALEELLSLRLCVSLFTEALEASPSHSAAKRLSFLLENQLQIVLDLVSKFVTSPLPSSSITVTATATATTTTATRRTTASLLPSEVEDVTRRLVELFTQAQKTLSTLITGMDYYEAALRVLRSFLKRSP